MERRAVESRHQSEDPIVARWSQLTACTEAQRSVASVLTETHAEETSA